VGTTLLEVKTVDGEVRARITDRGSWKPPAINPSNSGRGLILMRAISDAMEIDSSPTGTTVDINFRLPAAPAGVDDWSDGR
jgi:anti-sigma regulatory factor (Ser/Thr protein kinase)